MSPRSVTGLAGLAFRRTAPPLLVVGLAGVVLLAATRSYRPLELASIDETTLDALARQGAWSAFLVAAVPLFLWRAARAGRAWRTDADWLAPLPWSRGARALALGAGVAVAALALTLLAVVGALLAVDGGAPALRTVRILATPAHVLNAATPPWELPLAAAADGGDRVVVRLGVLPGSGPAVDVFVRVRGADGERAQATRRAFGRTRVELPLPGAGPWTLEVGRGGPGAVLYLPRDGVALARTVPAWRGDVALGLRALLLLVAWGLLAFGLGAHLRTSLAAGTAGALLLSPASVGLAANAWPGAGLAAHVEALALGLVPAAPAAADAAAALLVAGLGLLAHARGQRGRGTA